MIIYDLSLIIEFYHQSVYQMRSQNLEQQQKSNYSYKKNTYIKLNSAVHPGFNRSN